jgi:hypothetical protein
MALPYPQGRAPGPSAAATPGPTATIRSTIDAAMAIQDLTRRMSWSRSTSSRAPCGGSAVPPAGPPVVSAFATPRIYSDVLIMSEAVEHCVQTGQPRHERRGIAGLGTAGSDQAARTLIPGQRVRSVRNWCAGVKKMRRRPRAMTMVVTETEPKTKYMITSCAWTASIGLTPARIRPTRIPGKKTIPTAFVVSICGMSAVSTDSRRYGAAACDDAGVPGQQHHARAAGGPDTAGDYRAA